MEPTEVCIVCHTTISVIAQLQAVPCRGGRAHGPCSEMQARGTVGAGPIDAPVVLRRTAPDALRALTDDILAGLEVLNDASHLAERGGARVPVEQLTERAGNLAMSLWGNFRIELPEDITKPLPLDPTDDRTTFEAPSHPVGCTCAVCLH